MKRFTLFLILLVSIALIAGCGNTSIDAKADPTRAPTVDNGTVDLSTYKGDWKLKVTEDEELYLITALEVYLGSTGINIKEIKNNSVKGSIFSITGAPSHRQAVVDFEGKINDNKMIATYEDKAWLYNGDMELTFEDGKVLTHITRNKTDSSPMWGIPEGDFTFVRPIKTEIVRMSKSEKSKLEKFLSPVVKDRIKPFDQSKLTDVMVINFVGINVGAGFIDTGEFGSRVKQENGNVIFDKSVMDDLANRYFGVGIKEHMSYDVITYKDGFYTVPALGGVSQYPVVKFLMKDSENEGIYYAFVNYMFDDPEKGKQLEYQDLIKLQKNSGDYIIKEIKEVKYKIDFKN